MMNDLLAKPASRWDCHVHVFDVAAPVVAGHYQPIHRPLVDIETLAQSAGFGHLVLVQPSVYGTDNRVLLEGLQSSAGRHRGVAVVDPQITDDALEEMHRLGVRGLRFNLVSPVGNRESMAANFRALAPRLLELGWHVQWYAPLQDLPAIADLHEGTRVPAVLDHLAGLHPGVTSADPAWQALQRLSQLGGWIKLSGWYRLQCQAPYQDIAPFLSQAVALFYPRIVWGSDWPHTAFEPSAIPTYDSLIQPVRRALPPDVQALAFETAAAALYA